VLVLVHLVRNFASCPSETPRLHSCGGQTFSKGEASWYLRGSGEDIETWLAIRSLNVSCKLLLLFLILAYPDLRCCSAGTYGIANEIIRLPNEKASPNRHAQVVRKLAALRNPPRYATAHDVSDREVWFDNGQVPGREISSALTRR
jgi:hypothetical protein